MKTTFYLVRHGQPDWDWAEAMRFYGPCSAYMPLTPLGVEQIEHTACDSQLRGASFILASPYTRTMQSAQILSRRLGRYLYNSFQRIFTVFHMKLCSAAAEQL